MAHFLEQKLKICIGEWNATFDAIVYFADGQFAFMTH